jgi:long-chain acyl-CoA synthetase
MLYQRWCAIADRQRDDVALRDLPSGRVWTFGELHAAAETVSLPPNGMVFPQGNTPGFLLTLLAAWRTGRVVCPLEASQGRGLDQIDGLASTGRARHSGRAAPGRPDSGAQGGTRPAGDGHTVTHSNPALPLPPAPVVHVKTTSATSGAARCVVFTASQLAADADNIVATMGLRPEWPNIGVISLAHSYGFSNLVLPLVLHGVPLILAGPPLPESVRRAAATESAVTLAAVPALWRTWHEADAIPASVKLAISAGAPLPLPLEQAVLQERGLKIHNFYGSSECGGIAYDAGEETRPDAAIVGAPMPNVELSVSRDGCLIVRSDAVGLGYWPAGDPALDQGCFQTQDIAEIIGGAVFLRGRLGDQINVAGRKLDPASVEQALARHPAIVDCVVFGAPDPAGARGEAIVVCYQAGLAVTREELRRFLMDRLPAWQLPREWCAVDSLAPDQRGKLSRAAWRKWFLERQSSPQGFTAASRPE